MWYDILQILQIRRARERGEGETCCPLNIFFNTSAISRESYSLSQERRYCENIKKRYLLHFFFLSGHYMSLVLYVPQIPWRYLAISENVSCVISFVPVYGKMKKDITQMSWGYLCAVRVLLPVNTQQHCNLGKRKWRLIHICMNLLHTTVRIYCTRP